MRKRHLKSRPFERKGAIRASCIFEAQARPARYVTKARAFKCRGCQSVSFLRQLSMIVALVAPFKVARAIAVMIVENYRVLGTVVALVIIYRVAVFMENW